MSDLILKVKTTRKTFDATPVKNALTAKLAALTLLIDNNDPQITGAVNALAEEINNITDVAGFPFVPNELLVRTLPGADIAGGTTDIYFELKDTNVDNTRYLSRQWSDCGNVKAPLALIANAAHPTTGTLNVRVINAFLSVFNLSLDEEAMNGAPSV